MPASVTRVLETCIFSTHVLKSRATLRRKGLSPCVFRPCNQERTPETLQPEPESSVHFPGLLNAQSFCRQCRAFRMGLVRFFGGSWGAKKPRFFTRSSAAPSPKPPVHFPGHPKRTEPAGTLRGFWGGITWKTHAVLAALNPKP